MGEHTLRIPMKMHALNRQRLCKALQENGQAGAGAVVLLQGGDAHQRYCTDVDVTTFRQASYVFIQLISQPGNFLFGLIIFTKMY